MNTKLLTFQANKEFKGSKIKTLRPAFNKTHKEWIWVWFGHYTSQSGYVRMTKNYVDDGQMASMEPLKIEIMVFDKLIYIQFILFKILIKNDLL